MNMFDRVPTQEEEAKLIEQNKRDYEELMEFLKKTFCNFTTNKVEDYETVKFMPSFQSISGHFTVYKKWTFEKGTRWVEINEVRESRTGSISFLPKQVRDSFILETSMPLKTSPALTRMIVSRLEKPITYNIKQMELRRHNRKCFFTLRRVDKGFNRPTYSPFPLSCKETIEILNQNKESF